MILLGNTKQNLNFTIMISISTITIVYITLIKVSSLSSNGKCFKNQFSWLKLKFKALFLGVVIRILERNAKPITVKSIIYFYRYIGKESIPYNIFNGGAPNN
jgi:hypothetical protein